MIVRLTCFLILTGLLTGWPSGSASALSTEQLRAKLAKEMRYAGGQSGAFVADVQAGRTLFSSKSSTRRVPASVEKLVTTASVILRDGPGFTIPTTVVTDGVLDAKGRLTGDLYMVGSGDPTLTIARVDELAGELADLGVTRVGRVFGDDDAWDQRIGGPDSNFAYDFWLGGQLRALAVNRGIQRGRLIPDPAGDAALQLTRALRERDIKVASVGGPASAPAAAKEIARVQSPTIATLAKATNVPSDNYVADMLLKGLGDRHGTIGSSAEGARIARLTLAPLRIRPRVVDGSGLSRKNRISPREVVALLRGVSAREPAAQAFADSLAIAGRTGTIARRMRGTAAAEACRAKTGTLDGVSALAGYCSARDGGDVAFAILMQNVGIFTAHNTQDRMAAAIARWNG